MICLQCKQKITDDNRQTYKYNLKLPYCKNCTEAYNNNKKEKAIKSAFGKKQLQKIRKMNQEQKEHIKKTLIQQGHTQKEIEEAWTKYNL